MTNYQDGELLNLLSAPMAEDVDIIALSYAIKMGIAKFIIYVARTTMYADVDNQPEEILDYMAVELDAAYYEQTMNMETKRELIKNALKWYMAAGTGKSVKELVDTVFGGGDVSEWYEFGGEPGEFNIEIEEQLTEENYGRLSTVLSSTKPSSAHLKEISSKRDAETDLHLGSTLTGQPALTIYEDYSATTELNGTVRVGVSLTSEAVVTIYENYSVTTELSKAVYAGETLASEAVVTIYENYSVTTELSKAVYAGETLASEAVVTIYENYSVTTELSKAVYAGETLASEAVVTIYENYSVTTELSKAVYAGETLASEAIQQLAM